MVTKFDICSNALLELGEDVISSFTANTDPSKIAGSIYPEYIRHLQSIHPWNFTIKKVQLGRLAETPLNEWKYKYQLPSDMLIFRAFFNSSSEGVQPMQGFERFEDEVWTNEEAVYIDYQFEVDASNFPTYFTEFATKALAAKFAMPITDDKSLLELKKVEAFGSPSDNQNGGEFGVAKKLDSQQIASSAIKADDLILARFS
jgi:hypothetical protein